MMRKLKMSLLARQHKRNKSHDVDNPARSDQSPGLVHVNPLETETALPDKPSSVLSLDGIEVWHDCPDATVDICFIHGLTGDRNSSWTAPGQPAAWPKTLLPSRLPKARIVTYGYDAYVVRKSVASKNRLIDHATNLMHDLTTDRASCHASSRPIIFVAHSLGGLVCKEAILLSRHSPELHLRAVFDCVIGIIFMGTPHRGTWMADWSRIPAMALGLAKSTNISLLTVLQTDDQFLESIQIGFWSMMRELQRAGRSLEATCFFEELPLPVFGKVVSKDSATFEGYSSVSIHANHSDMVRFGSADDNGFKRLLGELIRLTTQIRGSAASQQPTRSMEETQIDEPASSGFNNYSYGNQFYAPGGTQNISTGSGNQFPGATFHAPVTFN